MAADVPATRQDISSHGIDLFNPNNPFSALEGSMIWWLHENPKITIFYIPKGIYLIKLP